LFRRAAEAELEERVRRGDVWRRRGVEALSRREVGRRNRQAATAATGSDRLATGRKGASRSSVPAVASVPAGPTRPTGLTCPTSLAGLGCVTDRRGRAKLLGRVPVASGQQPAIEGLIDVFGPRVPSQTTAAPFTLLP
jgi:hypothetical protein